MDAFEILVLILSILLAIVLTLSIVAIVILIKIIRHIKSIVLQAESVMHDVESVSSFFRKTAPTVAIGNLVANIISHFSLFKDSKNKKGSKSNEEK